MMTNTVAFGTGKNPLFEAWTMYLVQHDNIKPIKSILTADQTYEPCLFAPNIYTGVVWIV